MLTVLAASSALTVWWLWPLPRHCAAALSYPLQDMPGVTADFYLILWSLAWDVHVLATAPWNLFHGNIFHPSPFSLAYSEHFLGNLPLFAPTYLITSDPVLSANLLIFLTYPLCAAAMYAFLRQWVAAPSAVVAALAFAFSGYRHSIPPYVYLLSTFYLPLAALFFSRWLRDRRTSDLALFSIVLLLQLLVSYYLAYATIVGLGGFALATAVDPSSRKVSLRGWSMLLFALGAVGAAFLGISLPYLDLKALGIIPTYDETNVGHFTTLGLVPYFAARRLEAHWKEFGPPIVFLALALAGIARPSRDRRWPLVVGIYCCVFGVLLAFGRAVCVNGYDWWSPYGALAALIPGFGAIRQPIRFLALFEFGLAILVGLGSDRLFGRAQARWAFVAAVAAIWLWGASHLTAHPLHFVRPTPVEREPYEWLAGHGGDAAVLELPRAHSFTAAARRMVLSTIHWLPIVEGYSGYYPRTDSFLYGIAGGLPRSEALQELVDFAAIGWVLVHLEELSDAQRGRWEGLSETPGLVLAKRWDQALLFRVTLGMRHERRDRLFSRATSFGGAPLVPLEGSCAGWLELAKSPPMPVRARSALRLRARVHNATAATWPGEGFLPRHLVRLRWTLTRSDGRRLGSGTAALPTDVPPWSSVDVPVSLQVPAWPGQYTLRLELEQAMDRLLSACGMQSILVQVPVDAAAPGGT